MSTARGAQMAKSKITLYVQMHPHVTYSNDLTNRNCYTRVSWMGIPFYYGTKHWTRMMHFQIVFECIAYCMSRPKFLWTDHVAHSKNEPDQQSTNFRSLFSCKYHRYCSYHKWIRTFDWYICVLRLLENSLLGRDGNSKILNDHRYKIVDIGLRVKYNVQKSAKMSGHNMSPCIINDSVDVPKCLNYPKWKMNSENKVH